MCQLNPVDCPTAGYDVPYLKEQGRPSALYIIPLKFYINVTSTRVNDNSDGVEATDFQCSNCHETIALNEFQDHKMLCTQKK